jgi:ABC-2 type transport system permease protein
MDMTKLDTTTADEHRAIEIVPVRVAEPGFAQDLRGVKIVLQRELIRFGQDRTRMISALIQPMLFLFVLGGGLSSLTRGSTGGVDLKTFLFPGVLATSTLFTAVFSAISIVWDREFGFLREMLVAPVSRGSIMVGKCLGGATVATLQGCLVLVLAGFVHVPYSPVMLITLIGEVFLLSFMLTALGLVIAARIQQMQAVMGIMQMLLLPLSFMSGALYPIRNLPGWLGFVVRVNPITYAVHAVRTNVFNHLNLTPEAREALNPPLRWGSYTVDVWLQLTIVGVIGLLLMAIAIAQFNHAE